MLAGAYAAWWAYGRPRSEWPRIAVAAAAAPVIWMAFDLAVTGNPFHSLTGTRRASPRSWRGRGPRRRDHRRAPVHRWNLDDEVIIWGGVLGMALALRVAWDRAALLLAILAVSVATFLGLGLFGLPVLVRYMLLPSVIIALFFAFAVAGWIDSPDVGGGRGGRGPRRAPCWQSCSSPRCPMRATGWRRSTPSRSSSGPFQLQLGEVLDDPGSPRLHAAETHARPQPPRDPAGGLLARRERLARRVGPARAPRPGAPRVPDDPLGPARLGARSARAARPRLRRATRPRRRGVELELGRATTPTAPAVDRAERRGLRSTHRDPARR